VPLSENRWFSVLYQFDVAILQALNRVVGVWPTFDRALAVVCEWSFVRAAGLVAIVCWAWVAVRERNHRRLILIGLVGLTIATALSKLIQMSLFVHLRPFREAVELGLILPSGLATNWGRGSSFPSDTATLYFALAMVVFSVSRRLGLGAFIWVAVLIAIPRVYLMVHHASDILGGAALGIGTVWAMQRYTFEWPIWDRILAFELRTPQVFYPVMFCYGYQVVDAFQFFDQTLKYLKPH
jgi:undecaprenyl-diphosphatase